MKLWVGAWTWSRDHESRIYEFKIVSKWVYVSILSNCVEKNIEKCVRLINGYSINVIAKGRRYKEAPNVYGF